MKFRKITAFLLSLVVLISASVATVNAIEYEEVIYTEISVPENRLPSNNGVANSIEQLLGSKYNSFKEYLRKELAECNTEIDISSYNIARNNTNMEALVSVICDDIPEAFHVSGSFSFSSMDSNFHAIYVSYNCTKDQYSAMVNEIQPVISNLLSGISGNDSLSEEQKALLLHDRLAVLCEYDYQNYLNDTVPRESYTMYGTLANKIAVCQGYAETYQYLLEKVGIESYLCSSDKLFHAWNIVKINGSYYHVDVTWDDPVFDVIGRVRHDNFLRSTQGIKSSGHNADDFDTTPTSTYYDNYFWQNSDTAFQVVGKDVYYTDNQNAYLKKYNGTNVCSVDDIWYATSGGYWKGNYSRLSSDGNDLFFTKSDAVYKYDLDSKTTEKIFTPENPYGKGFNIYGFKYEDGKLICEQRDTPNQTNNVRIVMEDYAVAPVMYTVSYNVEGGTVTPGSSVVAKGSSVTLPTPSKSVQVTYNANGGTKAPSAQNINLYCDGWATSKDATVGEYKCASLFTPNNNVILYAVWQETTATLTSSVPTRDGYKFLGWSKESDATTASYAQAGKIDLTGNVTLYAVWEKTVSEETEGFFIKTFDLGDGSVTKVNFFTPGNGDPLYSLEFSDSDRIKINLAGITKGVYKIMVAKENHVRRLFNVDIRSDDMNIELQINPVGDINGDGKVNTVDVARANAHAKGVKILADYEFDCANVTGDAKVNTVDVAKINAHAKGVSSLWK